jgi:peptide/nickel transport system ATP-binding protein
LRLYPQRSAQTDGQIHIDGQDVLGLKGRALEQYRGGTVSMVFQEPGVAFDPVYTIGQQIVQAIRAHYPISGKAATEQALALLERVQIPQAARRFHAYPHELSGGMRQRAMIALALSCKPKLLLADEPTTALDATVQIQILLLLRELQKEMNMSVIFVTHDIGAAVEVADRIAVMYAGRIVEQGAVADVVHRPMHPYTAGLLASTVDASDKGQPLKAIPGAPPDMSNPPVGCAFAARCGYASSQCLVQPPVDVLQGHAVACWHPLNQVAA